MTALTLIDEIRVEADHTLAEEDIQFLRREIEQELRKTLSKTLFTAENCPPRRYSNAQVKLLTRAYNVLLERA